MSTRVRTGTIVIVEDDPFIASFLGAVILHGMLFYMEYSQTDQKGEQPSGVPITFQWHISA